MCSIQVMDQSQEQVYITAEVHELLDGNLYY